MAKERIESMGRRRRIVKRWSWVMLVIGDPLLQLLLLLSAIGWGSSREL
jgi:hypothetical protein